MMLIVCRKRLAGEINWIGRQVFSYQLTKVITCMQHSGEFAEVLGGVSGTKDIFRSILQHISTQRPLWDQGNPWEPAGYTTS
jgi:hypothetical protein